MGDYEILMLIIDLRVKIKKEKNGERIILEAPDPKGGSPYVITRRVPESERDRVMEDHIGPACLQLKLSILEGR